MPNPQALIDLLKQYVPSFAGGTLRARNVAPIPFQNEINARLNGREPTQEEVLADALQAVLMAVPLNPREPISRSTQVPLTPFHNRAVSMTNKLLREGHSAPVHIPDEVTASLLPRAVVDRTTGKTAIQEYLKETIHDDVLRAGVREGILPRQALTQVTGTRNAAADAAVRNSPSGLPAVDFGYYYPEKNLLFDYSAGSELQDYIWKTAQEAVRRRYRQ